MFTPSQMPSDALVAQHVDWLCSSKDICIARYMLSADSFDGLEQAHGILMTDTELDALEASPVEEEEAGMTDLGIQFVAGNFIIARADSLEPLKEWMQADPVELADGYQRS